MALPVDRTIYVVVAVGLSFTVTGVVLLGGLVGESCCDFGGGKFALGGGMWDVGFGGCEICV